MEFPYTYDKIQITNFFKKEERERATTMESSFVVYNLRIVLQRDLFWLLVYQNDDDDNSSNVTYVEKHRIVLKSFFQQKVSEGACA